MTGKNPPSHPKRQSLSLVVRRLIEAPAETLFDAWTDPVRIKAWWGPSGVTCSGAEVDLRRGGRYRIANLMPDGKTLWILGEFESVERPRRLVYSWRVEPGSDAVERVVIRFEPRGEATEIIVVHERIASAALRDGHERGWDGCLEKLAGYAQGLGPRS